MFFGSDLQAGWCMGPLSRGLQACTFYMRSALKICRCCSFLFGCTWSCRFFSCFYPVRGFTMWPCVCIRESKEELEGEYIEEHLGANKAWHVELGGPC